MKIEVRLSIGFVEGACQHDELEIDDSELNGLTPEMRKKYIDAEVADWANNYIEYSWKEIKEKGARDDERK